MLALEDKNIDVIGTLQTGEVTEAGADDLLYKTAVKQRPEVRDLRHRISVSEELVNIAKADDKPRLDFKGGYGWKWYEYEEMYKDGEAWNAGIYLSFPFFDGLAD